MKALPVELPEVVVLIGPPMGKPHAATAAALPDSGSRPVVVINLLLDPLWIDSKQTTLVRGAAGRSP